MTSLYKWLYTHIGGRMWTYILRDSYHDYPLLWLLGLLMLGAIIGNHYGILTTIKVEGILLIGSLLGHLFWGTKYHKGETK